MLINLTGLSHPFVKKFERSHKPMSFIYCQFNQNLSWRKTKGYPPFTTFSLHSWNGGYG